MGAKVEHYLCHPLGWGRVPLFRDQSERFLRDVAIPQIRAKCFWEGDRLSGHGAIYARRRRRQDYNSRAQQSKRRDGLALGLQLFIRPTAPVQISLPEAAGSGGLGSNRTNLIDSTYIYDRIDSTRLDLTKSNGRLFGLIPILLLD